VLKTNCFSLGPFLPVRAYPMGPLCADARDAVSVHQTPSPRRHLPTVGLLGLSITATASYSSSPRTWGPRSSLSRTQSPTAGLHPGASSPSAPSEPHPQGPFSSSEMHHSAVAVETRAGHLHPSYAKFRTLPSSPPPVSTYLWSPRPPLSFT
jgi:hypothetical protein